MGFFRHYAVPSEPPLSRVPDARERREFIEGELYELREQLGELTLACWRIWD